MNFIGEFNELKSGIKELNMASDKSITLDRTEKGYKIIGKDNVYNLSYNTKTDFFRAVTILNGISDGESIDVSAVNRFDNCGIMIDVSRNAVLKVETVMDIIRYMAKMGLNQLMLYTEDTYKIDEYPYFGYMRGAYSVEEIRQIVDYADIFGIECVPCIQTLAHLKNALRWSVTENMKDICDTDDILLVGEEKTYKLIECMIKTVRKSFKTDKIHIGMDEAHFIGLGRYLDKHGYTNRFKLLSEHLNRVCDIAAKYGFKPMMWSDMFFRLHCGGYYPIKGLPEEVVNLIPENVSLVYWDYYTQDKESYDMMIKTHIATSHKTIFAGGVWTWAGIALNYDKTFRTTIPALEACTENGVTDVVATLWGDDGAECSIYEALLGMQLYAEYNYSAEPERELNKMFKICTGFDADAFKLFGIDTFDSEQCPSHDITVSKQVLYQDILQGFFDKNFSVIDLKKHYAGYLEKLHKLPDMGSLEYLFDYHTDLVKLLYLKCDIGLRITSAYKSNDKAELKNLCFELEKILSLYEKIQEKLADIWYKNNKAFGFETIDMRFGCMEARTKRAIKRINAFVYGELDSIEELDEERLWYGKENCPYVPGRFFSRIFNYQE